MKKSIFLILFGIFAAMQMSGARAYPKPKTIVQPDGTSLTVIGHGDEFCHYVTTADGYTVVRGSDGVYRYAVSDNGRLRPSEVKALDEAERSASDRDFLFRLTRGIRPAVTATGLKLMSLEGRNDGLFSCNGAGRAGTIRRAGGVSGDNYRGLVIMVNFTDRKFSRGDKSWQLVDEMMNKPDYVSYDDPLLNGRFECTGSVRDYFSDNSNGMFVPEFDVVGPVEVDVDQYYINGTERTYELCRKVLETANADIDYSRYDSDGDGVVDMFYVIYAGYAAIYQGNDERLVWPHAGHFADSDIDLTLDGMRFGRFACSSEIYGWHADGDRYLDGIGVIVHEFSHVLGFKDHYDVSGYMNEDPGSWDVMASGNYNGILNSTPCGYNSYEKYAAGFISPRTVTCDNRDETVSLRPLSSSDDAVRIVSMQDSTMFLLENRQLEKWDAHLPGHGMLVWRVDSCDTAMWEHNALNVNGRLHFKLIRANGPTRSLFNEISDMDYDPFPGTRGISDLTNYSIESNLLSDLRYPSPVVLRDIREDEGMVRFYLEDDPAALAEPYTFCLKERYKATGIGKDGEECKWHVRTGTVESNGREKDVIFDLVPDTRNIASTNPKYADGLSATYMKDADRKSVIIEPYRVALMEDYGVWLVDFNDLDNGGSGAIALDMDPYGNISLANPESVLGYCLMHKNSVVVTPDKIVERFSLVRDIHFTGTSGLDHNTDDSMDTPLRPHDDIIHDLRGMRVTNPQKGEIYIINGQKHQH